MAVSVSIAVECSTDNVSVCFFFLLNINSLEWAIDWPTFRRFLRIIWQWICIKRSISFYGIDFMQSQRRLTTRVDAMDQYWLTVGMFWLRPTVSFNMNAIEIRHPHRCQKAPTKFRLHSSKFWSACKTNSTYPHKSMGISFSRHDAFGWNRIKTMPLIRIWRWLERISLYFITARRCRTEFCLKMITFYNHKFQRWPRKTVTQ